MSLGVDFLMGLGRGASRAREEQKVKELEEREQREQTQKRSLEFLGKLIDTDNLLPDEARNVAAQHYFRLAMNPKAKEGDFTRAVQESMAVANMPRTPATPRNTQIDRAKTIDDARQVNDVDYGSLMAGSPGLMAPFGLAAREGGRSANMMLPTREDYGKFLNAPKDTYSGFLSREEIEARDEAALRRRLGIQRDFATPRTTNIEGHDGIYTIDQTGKNVAFTPFRTPPAEKTGGSSDFERMLDRRKAAWQAANPGRQLTPDIEYQLGLDVRKEFNTVDDRPPTPRVPRYSRSTFQNPDGSLVEVVSDMTDPNVPVVVRPLPGGVQRPDNAAARDQRASMQGSLAMVKAMLDQFDTGQVDPNSVFGKYNSAVYSLRASGWVPGMAPPQEFETQIRTDIANINNELTKMRSGAAVSASEWSRLKNELPLPGMQPDEVVRRLRAYHTRLNRIFSLRYGPNGRGDAAAFPGDVEASGGGGGGGVAPSPTTPNPRQLPPPVPPPGFTPVAPR